MLELKKITIIEYLLQRLKELGVDTIFGVPGDYNLRILDYIEEDKNIQWIGTCNELNSAYACDGYARIKGCGAVLTTFGVGELSAINGIAGSYTEFVPVVIITGMPALSVQKRKAIVHHTLRAEDFCVFANIYRNVTVSSTQLNKVNACSEIDRVLRDCWIQKRPVYIGIPEDIVDELVLPPSNALDLSYPLSDPETVKECVSQIASLIKHSTKPVFLIDICALRHPIKPLIDKLINLTGIPIATMAMGKGLINESHPQFIGQYFGKYGDNNVRRQIENSDCIITIGTLLTDFNTGKFTINFNVNVTVEIHSRYVKFEHAIYPDIYYDAVLPELIKLLEGYKYQNKINKSAKVKAPKKGTHLTQEYFWYRIEKFLPENAIILAEIGTSLFGTKDIQLPDNSRYISQLLWGSIGYTFAALLGASIADRKSQAILFEGDGAFQMTAQELSSMIRNKLNPIIFLLNNDGYTIERVIRGINRKYNDIQKWNYVKFAQSFGEKIFTSKVRTQEELESLLVELPRHKNKLRFVEIVMDRMDTPITLKKMLANKFESDF